MHILTHFLVGGFICTLLAGRQKMSFYNKIAFISMGGFFGIFPDFFGPRDISPWSHSILIMSLIMIPIAYLLKRFIFNRTYLSLYLSVTGSVLIGHIFVDYLGHGVHMFYPISQKAFSLHLIFLSDPTVWFPILIGIVSFLLPIKRKLFVDWMLVSLVIIYLGIKLITVLQIEQHIGEEYALTGNAVISVYPLEEYQVEELSDYWKLGYNVTDSQRDIRGIVPLLTKDNFVNVNYIYNSKGEVIISPTGKDKMERVYRESAMDNEQPFFVKKETQAGDNAVILAENREGDKYVFFLQDNIWSLVPMDTKTQLITEGMGAK